LLEQLAPGDVTLLQINPPERHGRAMVAAARVRMPTLATPMAPTRLDRLARSTRDLLDTLAATFPSGGHTVLYNRPSILANKDGLRTESRRQEPPSKSKKLTLVPKPPLNCRPYR
jgi:hypothetical protein